MTALFISNDELKKSTFIGGNIDGAKLIPAIRTAQQIEIQDVLGTDLYNKISDGILYDNLEEPYLSLKKDYIHDVLIHYALSYYIPFSNYQVTNGGVSSWNGGDNFEAAQIDQINYLVNKEKNFADNYRARLIKHLCNNTSLYPEYLTSSGEDVNPSTGVNRTSIFLD